MKFRPGDIIDCDYPIVYRSKEAFARTRCVVLFLAKRNNRLQVEPCHGPGFDPARGRGIRYVDAGTATLVKRRLADTVGGVVAA